MYGTIARYHLKPGMEKELMGIEAELREAKPPGFVAEFIYRMDGDPSEHFEVVLFESKEAYFALANSPEQDARYRKLLEILEAPPEWHDGEIVYANPNPGAGHMGEAP